MEILDTSYREDLKETFICLEEKVQSLKKLRPFPNTALLEIREALLTEWTYNSNII